MKYILKDSNGLKYEANRKQRIHNEEHAQHSNAAF